MSDPSITEKMNAIERLIQLFRMERLAYLIVTTLSLVMLLYCGGVLIFRAQASMETLAPLFGSSGLITYTANRLFRMWDQAVRIVGGLDQPAAE
jgi:hypothetical protein